MMPEFSDEEILTLDTLAVKQAYSYGLQLEELCKGKIDEKATIHIEMIERWKAEAETIHNKLQQIIHIRTSQKEFCNQVQKL